MTILAEKSFRERIILAIDGRSAAGKTWLSDSLEESLAASAVHMDDFFIPRASRKSDDFHAVNGNFDRERFTKEVLLKLRSGECFSYGVFDCELNTVVRNRKVFQSNLIIVEGCYSTHPSLGKYYDLSVFCDISEEEQMLRIQRRNGKERAVSFKNRWIPMEEKYFKHHDILENADFHLFI